MQEEEFYDDEEYSYEYEVGSSCDECVNSGKLHLKVMIDDVGLLQIWSVVVVGGFLLTDLSLIFKLGFSQRLICAHTKY